MVQYFPVITGSLVVQGSVLITGSINTTAGITGSFSGTATTAQTASSVANLNQNVQITGSLTTSGTITAQTLNVQQVTSSIVFSSGSNVFGNSVSNTQQFTGSVSTTGSFSVTTTGTELQVGATGVTLGNALTDIHSVTGSLRVTGSVTSQAGFILGNSQTISPTGSIGYNNNVGVFVYGKSGSEADFRLYNAGGLTAMSVVAGTQNVSFNGNVGINNSTPTFRLDVSEAGSVINGTATVGSNMKGIRIYNSNTATNNNAVGLWFSTGPHQAGIASFRATADSTWETSLAFYTHVNATSNLNDATEKMRISGEGYVTMTSQPSFMAAGNAGSISVSGGNVIVFNANRYNTGGHYNNGNGRFTAPVAGKYLFSWNIYYFGGYVSAIVLTINGSQYAPADVVPYVYRSSTDPEGTAGCTVQLDLSANDYVEVRVRANYGAFQIYSSHSHFAGHLLG